MWRKANDSERLFIKKEFMPKEIVSAFIVALLDAALICFVVSLFPRDFSRISVSYVLISIPIALFLVYVFYYTFRTLYKFVKIAYKLHTNKYSVAECKIDEINVHRIGLINNANIVASTSDGESYRTSYGSPFTTKPSQGDQLSLFH